jgi:hypothetical protein
LTISRPSPGLSRYRSSISFIEDFSLILPKVIATARQEVNLFTEPDSPSSSFLNILSSLKGGETDFFQLSLYFLDFIRPVSITGGTYRDTARASRGLSLVDNTVDMKT